MESSRRDSDAAALPDLQRYSMCGEDVTGPADVQPFRGLQ
jgi:hypothetical protein